MGRFLPVRGHSACARAFFYPCEGLLLARIQAVFARYLRNPAAYRLTVSAPLFGKSGVLRPERRKEKLHPFVALQTAREPDVHAVYFINRFENLFCNVIFT